MTHDKALATGMHECASDCPAPAVHPRPRSLHPRIDTFVDLQAYLDKRLESIEADLNDEETMQSLGRDGRVRLLERRATLLDVQFKIIPAVMDAQLTREEDALESAWREAGYHSSLEVYQAEGR